MSGSEHVIDGPPSLVAPARRASAGVSVVMCVYTERRWTDICDGLAALGAQTRPPDEVLVVTDHADELLDRIRLTFPWVRALPNRGPRGLSAARNTGVAAARGAILAFLDDDARPAPDWLEHLVEPYADPDVVAVGGSAVPAWPAQRPRWFPPEFDWVVGCSYRGMPVQRSEIRNLMGCNMSFRADVLAGDTGFPVGVGRVGTKPMGCEETELCIRIRQRHRRARIIFEPSATVWHRVTPERTRWNYFLARCYAEGASKALVASHVGADDALQSERSYAFQTLPRGVREGIRSALGGQSTGLARAAAIVAGLGVTATGYGVAALRRRRVRAGGPRDGAGGAAPARGVVRQRQPRPVAPGLQAGTDRPEIASMASG